MQVWYTIKNDADSDLYVRKSGIQPQWLEKNWIADDARMLLKPGEQSQAICIMTQIPRDVSLGEYEVRFGMEGQFLSSHGGSGNLLQWSEPMFLPVQYPSKNVTVFVSHSTQDMHLVRQLQHYIENYGFSVIIAEDLTQPGVVLSDKFEGLIRTSDIIVGIVTPNGIRSEWVKQEVNYAHKIGKKIVLLVQDTVAFRSPLEYIKFSCNDSMGRIAQEISKILEPPQQNNNETASGPNWAPVAGAVVVGGIIAFLAGLAIGASAANAARRTP